MTKWETGATQVLTDTLAKAISTLSSQRSRTEPRAPHTTLELKFLATRMLEKTRFICPLAAANDATQEQRSLISPPESMRPPTCLLTDRVPAVAIAPMTQIFTSSKSMACESRRNDGASSSLRSIFVTERRGRCFRFGIAKAKRVSRQVESSWRPRGKNRRDRFEPLEAAKAAAPKKSYMCFYVCICTCIYIQAGDTGMAARDAGMT